jgi:hypothetical protein
MTSTSAPSSVQRVTWLLLLAALGAGAWLVTRPARVAPRAEPELWRAVPAGPELLVTIDVEALGASVAQELLQAGGGALLGLRELCGFEPLLGLRRVVLATPRSEPGQASDFALIAETRLAPEPVLRCAEAVIRKRGGTPVRSSLGAFTSVRDQHKPVGEMAIRADGLFVLSGGRYFREVIDSASGASRPDEASEVRSRIHAAVRGRLGRGQLALSLLVGPRLPLPGVQALGLSLNVQRDLELRGYVACPSPAGCAEAAKVVAELRHDVANESGISGLESIRVELHDRELDMRGNLARGELAPLLKQLLSP